MAEISTQRLIMRGWRESDLAPWAAMNADPEVRRYLGPLLSFEQAAAWVLNFQDDLDRHGFGFWAVEVRASGEFIGFTGLGSVDEAMPFTGVELGWRLARPAWGHGYATEAARAALGYGFDAMGLPEIIAITMAANLRSQAVMRRIGMTSDPAENFDDPDVDEGPLRRHVVFRKRRDRHQRSPFGAWGTRRHRPKTLRRRGHGEDAPAARVHQAGRLRPDRRGDQGDRDGRPARARPAHIADGGTPGGGKGLAVCRIAPPPGRLVSGGHYYNGGTLT